MHLVHRTREKKGALSSLDLPDLRFAPLLDKSHKLTCANPIVLGSVPLACSPHLRRVTGSTPAENDIRQGRFRVGSPDFPSARRLRLPKKVPRSTFLTFKHCSSVRSPKVSLLSPRLPARPTANKIPFLCPKYEVPSLVVPQYAKSPTANFLPNPQGG